MSTSTRIMAKVSAIMLGKSFVTKLKLATLVSLGLLLCQTVEAKAASLTNSYQFNGKGNWSLDAVGSNSTPVGILKALIPSGSAIEKAFLYSSAFSFSSTTTAPIVNFDGTIYNPSDFLALGLNPSSNVGLQAYRADVTNQVAAKVGSGGGLFDFNLLSEDPNGNIDGEVLAVIFSNPSERERTIAFLDGASSSAADSFTVNLADPLDTTTPGFEALLSLGIGFGFQPSSQFSLVDVDGKRLTSSAGGQDDGLGANGALITVGGLGDSPSNPADPFAPAIDERSDDELYEISSLLTQGSTAFSVKTQNPSGDDNIFFAGINITAKAGVDQPPTSVPTPALLPGLISLGLGVLRKRKAEASEQANNV